jgi:hypothetical protein
MTEHKCSVCQCGFTDDEGGVHGEFGIIPVSFCPDCTSCFYDMAEQLDDREWVGLTEDEVELYWDWEDFQTGAGRSTIFEMVRDIEAKLKEKNNG